MLSVTDNLKKQQICINLLKENNEKNSNKVECEDPSKKVFQKKSAGNEKTVKI